MKNKWLLVVTGNDRPGIIAGVSGVLYRAHCNLEDISMTVLEGAFAMIVVVTLRAGRKTLVDAALAQFGRSAKLSFDWKKLNQARPPKQKKGTDLYLVSAVGKDRTGIVYEISRELSRRHLNIQDLNSRILGVGSRAVYAMVLEVLLPHRYPIESLKRSFAGIGRKLRIDVNLKPVDRLEL